VELEEELERNSQDGGDHQDDPLTAIEPGPMRDEEGNESDGREEEPVEDHCTGVHLGEGDLAEEKSTAPEDTGEEGGDEAKGAVACGVLTQAVPPPPVTFCAKSSVERL